jgi:glutamate racemase
MKQTVVFTDSGLGGLSIMADFVRLAKLNQLNVDCVFFNAQHSRGFGYKKMDSKTQVEVFDRVLSTIDTMYRPNIIAVACNTLSVVYLKSDFYKNTDVKVLDIIETGKSLVKNSDSESVIEISMPTTTESGVYQDENKQIIAVSSNTSLPDAIENGYDKDIELIIENIFQDVQIKIETQKLQKKEHALFLACTHFPIIKDKFYDIAENLGIKINTLLNPNESFSQLVVDELINIKKGVGKEEEKGINTVKVISRTELQENEVKNISKLIENYSPETAEALRAYEYNPELF